MRTLVFVTQNKNKIDDAVKLLKDYTIEHVNFDVPEIQSFDIRKIVEHKIKHAYDLVRKPCFVQDTGLYLDCLKGFPGPLIRWYFETVGAETICKIAHMLQNPKCHWTTVLGYYDGNHIKYIEETVGGALPESPRGIGGYSWDNMVIPDGSTKTFAQMTFEEKQSYAVTRKILIRFKDFLEKQ